jgi:hypothetical protein
VIVEDACSANNGKYHDRMIKTFQWGFGRICIADGTIQELWQNLKERKVDIGTLLDVVGLFI